MNWHGGLPMFKFTMGLLLTTVFCSAGDITYNVDQTVGAGSVTAFVETNGTIGVLFELGNPRETLVRKRRSRLLA
jgi:hypothetical protein